MDDEDNERIYEGMLRMVLWGEEREKVFRMLEVNGVPLAQSEGLYRKAMKERVSAIRSECWKRIAVGAACLFVGIGLYWLFWYKFGGITRGIFLLCAVGVFVGLWKLLDGLAGVVLAPRKKGSLADEF